MLTRTLGLLILLPLIANCGFFSPAQITPNIVIVPGEATVESVEVVILTSFPLQVHLQVKGYLGDPCTQIGEIQSQRDGFMFEVSISTTRDGGLNCIQVIEPFEENIPLEVYGLPAGDYTVRVNGVEAQFTFHQDNVLGD